MRLFITPSTLSHRNLAIEELLFTHSQFDWIYLWRNAPSVIIGRKQNTLAEVNTDYARQTGIQIVRRLTGGGAVYQDLGNINISYIFTCGESDTFDKKCSDFLSDFIAYLHSIGIDAILSGRNDICIQNQNMTYKIAGTAMTQKGNRGIIHLCLLFDTDKEEMAKVLTPSIAKLDAKGVSSVRGRTINIKDFYSQFANHSADRFFDDIKKHYQATTNDCIQTVDKFTEIDGFESQIDNLCQSRYENRDWTFGRNPLGKFSHSKRFPIGTVELSMKVHKGKISLCHFTGDYLTAVDFDTIAEALIGKTFDEDHITAALSGFAIEDILKIIDRGEFIDFLLGRST